MPHNFESQKRTARDLVVSAKRQLSANETFADASLTRRLRFDSASVPELPQTRRSDKDMAGKGTEFATDGQVTSFDSSFNLKKEVDDWSIGWALAFIMGKLTDTDNMDGTFTHAIAFDETTTQAKMTNVYLQDTADVKTKYVDMAAKDLTLTYASRGSIMLDMNWAGTGKFTDVAMGALPALPVDYYLLNSDSVFSLGPSGGDLVDMTGRFMSGTVKIETGVVNHTAPGAGLYGVMMRTGMRKFSFQFVVAAKDTDDIRTLFINDTMSALSVVTTSPGLVGPSILDIEVPQFKLKANKLGQLQDMLIWSIEGDETTCYKIPTGADALSVNVTNNVATYLVGV